MPTPYPSTTSSQQVCQPRTLANSRPWLPRRRRDEIDGLAVVAAVDAEVLPVHGEDLAAGVLLGHDDDGGIGQIHRLEA